MALIFGGRDKSYAFDPHCNGTYPIREFQGKDLVVRCPVCGLEVRDRTFDVLVWKWRKALGKTEGPIPPSRTLPPCPRCGSDSGCHINGGSSGLSGYCGKVIWCPVCHVKTYEYTDFEHAEMAWAKGYVSTDEERAERRRKEAERIWQAVQPSETTEGVCWCSGLPWPNEVPTKRGRRKSLE